MGTILYTTGMATSVLWLIRTCLLPVGNVVGDSLGRTVLRLPRPNFRDAQRRRPLPLDRGCLRTEGAQQIGDSLDHTVLRLPRQTYRDAQRRKPLHKGCLSAEGAYQIGGSLDRTVLRFPGSGSTDAQRRRPLPADRYCFPTVFVKQTGNV